MGKFVRQIPQRPDVHWYWAIGLFLLAGCQIEARRVPEMGYRSWSAYGGSADFLHYSALDQINQENVHRLRVAWVYKTGDAFPGSEMQCNPIVIDGVLYATTPRLRVIALDAATGSLLWQFDPHNGQAPTTKLRNRGLAYWQDEIGNDRRLFVVVQHWLYALDARTGRPIASFGDSGRVDLRQGLGRDPQSLSITATSPGVVYRDLLILGSTVGEDLPAAPGDIRAFDVRTGTLRWSFHTIPHPGEFGYETWPSDAWTYVGGANAWSGLSLDTARGIVFAPTGSAAYDFYGGNRLGDNLFANTLLALDAATGRRLWHYQIVRHDVWDRDLPAPPTLVTLRRGRRLIDAVAQITKHGYVFIFERETGTPLFPIDEQPIPPSDVPGEQLAATQPIPRKPPPFVRTHFHDTLLTRRTPEAYQAVRAQLQRLRYGHPFTPPSFEGTVVFPGLDGGGEWGGAAFDPETGYLYVNANEMAWIIRLVPRGEARWSGRNIYRQFCASCHREDLRGNPPEFPSLEQARLAQRYTVPSLAAFLRSGSGRMPGFAYLGQGSLEAVAEFLLTGRDRALDAPPDSALLARLPYKHDGYNKFLDPEGYPAITPPWGTLTAINLDRGEIVWQIPLGEIPALAAQGLRHTGCENYGGPVVTAGGLVFIAATCDRKIRAFDKYTGRLLWEAALPAAGYATPAVYEVNGRQYVVIAAGGGKWGEPSGDSYVAFTLE